MIKKKKKRWSFIVSIAIALGGYLVFTDKTKGNILNNFPQDSHLINISRLLFAINMFLTSPLECFVCREVSFHITITITIAINIIII